jgi:hypothetical protein
MISISSEFWNGDRRRSNLARRSCGVDRFYGEEAAVFGAQIRADRVQQEKRLGYRQERLLHALVE